MMSNFDDLKLAVEALSGGRNTVLFDDDLGTGGESFPSIMVRIPMFYSFDVLTAAPDAPHPMFVVDDMTLPEVYFSKYQNIVMHDRAYSLPFKDPRTFITFDQAKAVSEAKGTGWHLATNAEYAGIALWCLKNGFQPRGNNNYGGDYAYSHEKGVVTYTYGTGTKGRIATGSGPVTWNHDGTPLGICDLNGNVREWVGGLRLKDGEINVIPHNNAAKHIDQSATSVQWQGILQDGTFVTPGTVNTLKFDTYITDTGLAMAILSTSITTISTDESYMHHSLSSLAAKEGVSVPTLLRLLGIMPPTGDINDDGFFARNDSERLAARGGGWDESSAAGVFMLDIKEPRTFSSSNTGFRTAFVNL